MIQRKICEMFASQTPQYKASGPAKRRKHVEMPTRPSAGSGMSDPATGGCAPVKPSNAALSTSTRDSTAPLDGNEHNSALPTHRSRCPARRELSPGFIAKKTQTADKSTQTDHVKFIIVPTEKPGQAAPRERNEALLKRKREETIKASEVIEISSGVDDSDCEIQKILPSPKRRFKHATPQARRVKPSSPAKPTSTQRAKKNGAAEPSPSQGRTRALSSVKSEAYRPDVRANMDRKKRPEADKKDPEIAARSSAVRTIPAESDSDCGIVKVQKSPRHPQHGKVVHLDVPRTSKKPLARATRAASSIQAISDTTIIKATPSPQRQQNEPILKDSVPERDVKTSRPGPNPAVLAHKKPKLTYTFQRRDIIPATTEAEPPSARSLVHQGHEESGKVEMTSRGHSVVGLPQMGKHPVRYSRDATLNIVPPNAAERPHNNGDLDSLPGPHAPGKSAKLPADADMDDKSSVLDLLLEKLNASITGGHASTEARPLVRDRLSEEPQSQVESKPVIDDVGFLRDDDDGILFASSPNGPERQKQTTSQDNDQDISQVDSGAWSPPSAQMPSSRQTARSATPSPAASSPPMSYDSSSKSDSSSGSSGDSISEDSDRLRLKCREDTPPTSVVSRDDLPWLPHCASELGSNAAKPKTTAPILHASTILPVCDAVKLERLHEEGRFGNFVPNHRSPVVGLKGILKQSPRQGDDVSSPRSGQRKPHAREDTPSSPTERIQRRKRQAVSALVRPRPAQPKKHLAEQLAVPAKSEGQAQQKTDTGEVLKQAYSQLARDGVSEHAVKPTMERLMARIADGETFPAPNGSWQPRPHRPLAASAVAAELRRRGIRTGSHYGNFWHNMMVCYSRLAGSPVPLFTMMKTAFDDFQNECLDIQHDMDDMDSSGGMDKIERKSASRDEKAKPLQGLQALLQWGNENDDDDDDGEDSSSSSSGSEE